MGWAYCTVALSEWYSVPNSHSIISFYLTGYLLLRHLLFIHISISLKHSTSTQRNHSGKVKWPTAKLFPWAGCEINHRVKYLSTNHTSLVGITWFAFLQYLSYILVCFGMEGVAFDPVRGDSHIGGYVAFD